MSRSIRPLQRTIMGETSSHETARIPMPKRNPSRFFPPVESADANGIVGAGGVLTTEWLVDAYRNGIFPWPMAEYARQMLWWSPDPRAIFELDGLVVTRRLAAKCRGKKFTVSSDRDFAGVIHGCGTAKGRKGHTWLIPEMVQAYQKLHDEGFAHSVEVWHDGQLAGGTYGVALGGLFAAESMFHRVTDASKVALVALRDHLRKQGYELWDIQQLTPHTESLGAIEISRDEYLRRLRAVIELPVTFGRIETRP